MLTRRARAPPADWARAGARGKARAGGDGTIAMRSRHRAATRNRRPAPPAPPGWRGLEAARADPASARIGPHWPALARIGRAFTKPTAAATSTALSALAANRRPARRRRRISPHDGPEAVRLAEQGASPACRRCPRRASRLRLRLRRTRRTRRSRRSRRKRRTPRNASHPSHPAPHLATRPRQSCAAPRIAAESRKKRRASPPQNA